nr:FAD-dependent oxidoreductase [Dolosigranulum pigrum]
MHMHCNSDVVGLNADEKTVDIIVDGEKSTMSYDKLLLSPGGVAVKPPFEGVELDNVNTFRGPEDTQKVLDDMKASKKAVVIGAGYIGLEVVEAFAKAGVDVRVIDMAERFLPTYLDKEFTDVLEAHAKENGVEFYGGERVQSFQGKDGKVAAVVTDKQTHEADTVVLSMGVKPDAGWLADELEMTDKGFVVTDDYLQTSVKDVYAGGDATFVPYAPTEGKTSIALATMARRQGVVAAMNAMGKEMKMPEMTGTSALSLFDYKFVNTGLNATSAESYEGNVASKYVEEPLYPEFMRKPGKVMMKIYYDEDDHRILGAQLMSKEDISTAIDTLSVAIAAKWTLEDLALADFFFQPRFDRPWHYLNVLAMAALDYKLGGADKLLF